MRDRLVFSCGEAADRFALYLDDELPEREARGLESHLEGCASCRSRAGGLARVDRDLARLSVEGSGDEVTAILAKARWVEAAGSRRRVHRARPEPARGWALPASLAAAALLCLAAALARPARPAGAERKPAPPPADSARAVEEVPRPAPLPEPIRGEPNGSTRPPAPPVPLPPPPPPAPVEAPATLAVRPAVVAHLVDGKALLDGAPAAPGAPIAAGQTLATDEERAELLCPDGTRLYLGPATSLAFPGAGKTLALARGEVAADVAPQAKENPLRFATPKAEVTVLGTFLAVLAGPESSRVEVERGRVEVRRRRDGWTVQVRGGQQVVVADGVTPLVRPLPANLLADSGFENGGQGWGGIWNAAMGRNFGGISVEAGKGRSGSAVQMSAASLVGRDREVFQDLPAAPGETVEAAGWVRTEGLGGNGARVSLLWLAGASTIEGSVALKSQGRVLREDTIGILAGTSGWVRVSGRAAAPAQARQARLLLYTDVDPDGAGTAWFDDWCLRRVAKSR